MIGRLKAAFAARRAAPAAPTGQTPPPAAATRTEGEEMDSHTGSLAAATQNRWAMHAAVRIMAFAAITACIIALIAILVAAWALTRPPENKYFATRMSGELIELTPLDQPHRSDTQVTNFAVDAITRSLSLDFANYRQELADVELFFTATGWEAFLAELQRSGNLELLRNRRMISSAVANGATVLRKGVDGDGIFTWHVETPLTITYQSSSESQTQNLTMMIEIKRVPTWTSDSGVAVSRLIGQSSR